MVKWDNLKNEKHVENGENVMNELSLLSVACSAMRHKVSDDTDTDVDELLGFFAGAESVLKRASDDVIGLVARFRELTEVPEAAAAKPNEAAGR